jgi:hypothetical protein
MKHWYMPFDVGAWKSDAAVSAASPATRGIWFELLCCMFNLDRCGQVSGTIDELARMCRCASSECLQSVSEIRARDIAEVTEKDGVYVIVNRRMRAEYKARDSKTLRNKRYRERQKEDTEKTEEETPEKSPSSYYGYCSNSNSSSLKGVQGEAPTLQQVLDYCGMGSGITRECGEAFWNAMDGCGWIDRAQRPIRNWQSVLRNFSNTWRANQTRDRLSKGGIPQPTPNLTARRNREEDFAPANHPDHPV